jgi:hypothetical protein
MYTGLSYMFHMLMLNVQAKTLQGNETSGGNPPHLHSAALAHLDTPQQNQNAVSEENHRRSIQEWMTGADSNRQHLAQTNGFHAGKRNPAQTPSLGCTTGGDFIHMGAWATDRR